MMTLAKLLAHTLILLAFVSVGTHALYAQTEDVPTDPPTETPGDTEDEDNDMSEFKDRVDVDSGPGVGLVNPLNNIDSLEDLVQVLIDAVVQIGSIILVLAIIYVGFKFVAAQGNEERIKEARAALVWTVIGGLILLGAEAISLVIQETTEAL